MEKSFIFLFCILKLIFGKEEINQLNDFKTISKEEDFYLSPTVDSVAYFESYDRRCLVYLSVNDDSKKERIDGQFYRLKTDQNYHFYIKLYNSESPSILKRYIAPIDLSNQEIYIKGNPISFLYLLKNKKYNLTFEENSSIKMISLSKKTINSKVKIKQEQEQEQALNSINCYYKLSNNIKKLEIETDDNDTFLEFLIKFNLEENYEFLDIGLFINNEKVKLDTKISHLPVPETQKEFEIKIFSKDSFKITFSNGFCNDIQYHYNYISDTFIDSIKNNDDYLISIIFHDVFRNINLINGEKFFLTFNIIDYNINEKQPIFIYYKESSLIDDLIDLKLEEFYCKNIIKYLKELFEIYVYSDIAKKPPEINGHPNYHHEKIDFQERLNNVSPNNRKFYEFYQEIEMIFATVKDPHLEIYADETPNGIKFSEYKAYLPFNFVIKKFKENDSKEYFRIFIEKNNNFGEYDEDTQNFLNVHINSPIKSINNIDPFDYIQNWSKFDQYKNMHAQFSRRMEQISSFYLYSFPLFYSDIIFNEYEFDDGGLIRMPYKIYIPKKKLVI